MRQYIIMSLLLVMLALDCMGCSRQKTEVQPTSCMEAEK